LTREIQKPVASPRKTIIRTIGKEKNGVTGVAFWGTIGFGFKF